MNIKKTLSVLLALGAGAAMAVDPATGSCGEYKVAKEISVTAQTQTIPVTLVREYDPEGGTNTENYVYWFKCTLKRKNSYSVWLSDAAAETAGAEPAIEIDSFDAEDASVYEDRTGIESFEPTAAFESYSGKWGAMHMLSADDWWIDDEDSTMSDPASWIYYLCIRGNKGDTVKVNIINANKLPLGIEENPLEITIKQTEARTSWQTLVTNEYSFYCHTTVEAGRRYIVATEGGASDAELDLEFGAGKVTEYTPWLTQYNSAWCFDPDAAGECDIVVATHTNKTHTLEQLNPAAKFRLRMVLLPTVAIGSHKCTVLNDANNFSATFQPGHINNPANFGKYYDTIIDQGLFKFQGVKGTRYAISTEGANTNLIMRLYTGTGEMFRENTEDGSSTGNVRCCFTADYSGVYYVGVAQKLEDDDLDEVTAGNVTIRVETAASVKGSPDEWDNADDDYTGATDLSPIPAQYIWQQPDVVDPEGHGPHQLGKTDWYDVFRIQGRTGLAYYINVTTVSGAMPPTMLKSEVYHYNGKNKVSDWFGGDLNPNSSNPLKFYGEENTTYYIRISNEDGLGLDYPDYIVHCCARSRENPDQPLASMRVTAKGCDTATWQLNSEKTQYPTGSTLVLEPATVKIKFSTVKGFNSPGTVTATLKGGQTVNEVIGTYTDKFDHKDDTTSGATSWSLKNKETTMARTFWSDDPADYFVFSPTKDGQYFDFWFDSQSGDEDAVFSIINATGDADHPDGVYASNVTSVNKLSLPKLKTKYYLKITHANASKPGDTGYVVAGMFTTAGAVKFAKTAVKVKKDAGSLALNVARTSKEGKTRVRYTVVPGTAKAGERYDGDLTGLLTWEAGDNKAKTISLKIIPDVLPIYKGDTQFTVQLSALDPSEVGTDEVRAQIVNPVCTVTITDNAKKNVTSAADAYAKSQAKKASGSEAGPFTAGTFFGVLGSSATGMNQLCSVTLTAGSGASPKISAKVALGGKNYSFSSKEAGWEESEKSGCVRKTLTLEQKVNGEVVVYTLVADVPNTSSSFDAIAEVTLTAGAVKYSGNAYRQNMKVQAYLDEMVNYAGYYTVALKPGVIAKVSGMPEAPEGNGYITITLDSKGTAKVAGLLADATKLSFTANGVKLVKGDNGSVTIPLFYAKGTCLFGGDLVLKRQKITETKPDGKTVNPDLKSYDIVASGADSELYWNNTSKNLSYDGQKEVALALNPVGGWYDKVLNLQGYYKDFATSLGIAAVSEFPKEALSSGYSYATGAADPSATAIDLANNSFSIPKKSLVKSGSAIDFTESVNPCNVQVKFARATGLVSGQFSVWSQSGSSQKEISGFKHNGVLLLQSDTTDDNGFADDVLTAGFLYKAFKVSGRNWTFSKPFNLLAD